MQEDLTEFEEAELDRVAEMDDWSVEPYTRKSLERRVLGKLRDGLSFKDAVIRVLAEVPREDDPGLLKKKAEEEAKKKTVENYKAKRRALIARLAKVPGLIS